MYADEETPLNEENPKPASESRVQHSLESENPPNQGESFWQQQQWKFNLSIAKSISNARRASDRAVEVSAIVQKGFSSGFQSFVDSANGFHFICSCLALYYVSAIVAFSHCFESWSYVDSLYFATITFLTIGYGDVSPSTDAGRLFTVFFAIFGIFILGFFLGLLGARLVEMETEAYATMREKARNQLKKAFGMKIDEKAEKQKPKTACGVICHILTLELPLIAVLFGLGILYGTQMEHWTVIESIYFSTITFSTVGFGDYAPEEPWARLVCIFLLPLIVAVFCELVGRIASAYLQHKLSLEEEAFLNRQLTRSDLERMDLDKTGKVSYGEFLHFVLLAMQKVDEEDILQLREVFNRLDVTGNGYLTTDDVSGLVVRQPGSRHLMVED
mmetsp:Transcript_6079/g.9320  ORF Transcript_6079/g.9320 Transcript_6079/m.9320 type:complete len:388 (+) Transcript_6079:146-1309(+)|eukprot:CAMPEP_0178916384 /NCGR_PEP_ID=MMETSP0786-20121207/12604_1 /TAXON_ID=186022 /ORGANISM="Thalassionema frauenfeldii, Strain CCMP 1798" /LENGTH=387 /DNA_ID=CAMNT_0020589703 /DNA_START=91 /DNA_END=1254 /DNA_ORIENTATION=-